MKKKLKTLVKQKEVSFDQAIECLADSMIENAKENYTSDIEPFEQYAEKLKAKIYADMETFKKRCNNGYHNLMNELKK